MNGVPAAAIRLILQVDHMQGDVADCDAQSGRLKLVYINLIYNLYTKYRSWLHGTRDTPRYQIISADRNPIRRKVAVRSSTRVGVIVVDLSIASSDPPSVRVRSPLRVAVRRCESICESYAYGFTDFLHMGSRISCIQVHALVECLL